MPPKAQYADREVTAKLANALAYPMAFTHPEQILDETARLPPSFHGVSCAKLDRHGSLRAVIRPRCR